MTTIARFEQGARARMTTSAARFEARARHLVEEG